MFQETTTKGMLLDISAMRSQALQLLNRGKEYDDFLNYWLSKYNYWDDDSSFPTLKEVSSETGLSNSKLKRFVKLIFDDLILGKDEGVEIIMNKIEYMFWMTYFDKSHVFIVKDLPVVPRVGEEVDLPFFKNTVGTTSFYVESVKHEFQDAKQYVVIRLKSGEYNKYWHIRKDEALIKGELHWRDFYSLMDYQLKEKLGLSSF